MWLACKGHTHQMAAATIRAKLMLGKISMQANLANYMPKGRQAKSQIHGREWRFHSLLVKVFSLCFNLEFHGIYIHIWSLVWYMSIVWSLIHILLLGLSYWWPMNACFVSLWYDSYGFLLLYRVYDVRPTLINAQKTWYVKQPENGWSANS